MKKSKEIFFKFSRTLFLNINYFGGGIKMVKKPTPVPEEEN